MLDYRTLEDKVTFLKDGEELVDICTLTYVGGQAPLTLIGVSEEYVARPDLISLAMYGTDKYADVICKYNGISNPFELNEGMLLKIPYETAIPDLFVAGVKAPLKAEDSDEITAPRQGFQKAKNEKRAPNEMCIGDKNFLVSEELGLIFY